MIADAWVRTYYKEKNLIAETHLVPATPFDIRESKIFFVNIITAFLISFMDYAF